MALTFVAPHNLRARPFVVPRGHDLHVWNRTPDVGCAVLVDGHRVGDAGSDAARVDPPRRAALAPRHAAGGDVRAALPAELRQRLASTAAPVGLSIGTDVRPAPPVYHQHDATPPPDREPRPHSRGRARAGAGPERPRAARPVRARRSSPRRSASCSVSRATPAPSARPRREAYVEAEFDVPDGFFDESRAARRSPSCGRRTSRGSCSRGACSATAARGRTRGDARSRARISRRRPERLIAMSGQFEQRRLARPAYQLDVLDAFVGAEQARRGAARRATAWRALDRRAPARTTRSPATRAPPPRGSRRCATSSSAPTACERGRGGGTASRARPHAPRGRARRGRRSGDGGRRARRRRRRGIARGRGRARARRR